MVGLSHVALRLMIRQYLPGESKTWWPTEMLNSRRLPQQNVGLTPETFRHDSEDFLVPQILGNEERFISESLAKLEEWGASGVDINMGCSVKKALRHNYGVALMGDPEYAASIVRMTVAHTSLPVSVKLRSGHKKDDHFLIDFVQKLKAAGASYITLHPRIAEQKRRIDADWSQILKLRKEVEIPVIGNGDIQNWEDAIRMWEETQCDGIMMGRALCARPWILWQLGHHFGLPAPKGREGELPPLSGEEEAYEFEKALLCFIEHCEAYFSSEHARKRILFFLRVATPWLNFGHSLTKRIGKSQSLDEMRLETKEFFSRTGLYMSKSTQFRF
jgi:tRNA-dihydrouridine synthase B